MKVAIYTRVSTSDQTTQNQLMDLEEVLKGIIGRSLNSMMKLLVVPKV